MEFFEIIDGTMLKDGDTLQITITKKTPTFTVALMPGISAPGKKTPEYMVPLLLNGTPQQLDANFFDAVAEPIVRSSTILNNLKQFEDSMQRSKPKPGKTENKEVEKLLQEADKLEKLNNFNGAIVMLKRAEAIQGADKPTIAKRIKSLQEKADTGSLFAFGGDEEITEAAEETELTYEPINEEEE